MSSFQEPPFARRNFNLLVGDVSTFLIGMAFLDSSTVFPLLVEHLGGSQTLIGLVLGGKQAMIFLPTLWAAHRLRGRPRYLPFLVKVAFWSRACLFLAALVLWLFGTRQPSLALAGFCVAYLLLWLGDGLGIVPWMALVGRMIPTAKRGRLFASTTLASALVKLGAAWLVGLLLRSNLLPFAASSSLLVLLAGVWMMISWGFLAALREPPPQEEKPTVEPPPLALGAYLKTLPPFLRQRPALWRLAAVQTLASSTGAAMPFLIGYTGRGNELAASFLNFQTLGLLLTAPLWGFLTDKLGPRRALLSLLCMALVAPLSALSGTLSLYFVAYFCAGAVMEGWSVSTNYLLESVGDDENQTTAIAVMNAAVAPSLFLPFLMGLAAEKLGPPAAFGMALTLLTLALFIARGLPNTRKVRDTNPA